MSPPGKPPGGSGASPEQRGAGAAAVPGHRPDPTAHAPEPADDAAGAPGATFDETVSDAPIPSRPRMPVVHSSDFDDPGTERLSPQVLAVIAPEGRYQVVDELARGGLGKLLRARDTRLGRTVAIKQLLRSGPEVEARFMREALITARLQHPAIVPIHDAGRLPTGDAFYAMKLVSGRTLEEVIAATHSLEERLALLPHLTAVAEAVAYAHSRGVIHRDLKPANVLCGEFGESVVIDWGLAKLTGSATGDLGAGPDDTPLPMAETQTGIVKGTPAYMPIEQARGLPVDERADVYALGALIYEALSGRPPYEGRSFREIHFKVLAGPPPPLGEVAPGVPRDLESVVARAMERDLAQRYPSGKALVEDLRRFQTGRLVRSHQYSLRERLGRFVKRHRVLVGVAAISLITLVVAVLLMLGEISQVRQRTRDADHRHRTIGQVQTAIRLMLREVQSVRDAAVQLASDPELIESLGSAEATARLGDTLGDRLRRLPASQVEVFDKRGASVLARIVGHEKGAMLLGPTAPSDPVLKRALGYRRGVELSLSPSGKLLLARIAAPVIDAEYNVRGVVLLAVPFDGKLALRLTRSLSGAEVILHAGTGPGYASYLYAAGVETPELPAPRVPFLEARLGPPRGVHFVAHQLIDGRDHSLGYAALRDPDGRPLGLLGVALPHEAPAPASFTSSRLVVPVVGTVLLLSIVLLLLLRRARGVQLLLLLGAAASAATAGGCQEGGPLGPPVRPAERRTTLHVATGSDPLDVSGLDPVLVSTVDSVEVGSQIFERLVKLSPDGQNVEPLLATRWSLSPSGTEWTFELRQGVRFHDGTPFDAQAVAFSFGRKRNWMGETLLGVIQRVDVLGPHKVRIVTKRPYSPFLANLATYSASIVSPAAVGKHGASFTRNAVGTGPFRLEGWKAHTRTVLVRNRNYWGPPPRLERLVFRVLRDERERLDALESGAAEVAAGFRSHDLPVVALHPQLRIHRVLGHNVVYVALNTVRPPFDDVVVRRAVNRAVNKEAIVNHFYGGYARVARGPVPPIIWSHHAQVQSEPFDPARARRELAGVAARLPPGERLQLYVLRQPRPYLPNPLEVTRLLQQNLRAAGLDVQVHFRDYKDFVAAIQAGKHHLCLTGWIGDNTDPDNFLYTLLHSENAASGAAANRALYRSPEYDALITRAQQTSVRPLREAAYRQAQELVGRDAPWIPLLHADGVMITRRDVGGTELGMRAWTHTDYAKLFLRQEPDR